MGSARSAVRRVSLAIGTLLVLSHCTFDASGLPPSPPNSYTCTCECLDEVLVVTSMPQESADDAEETLHDNVVLLTGNVLDLGELVPIGPQAVGVRFPNLEIPRNSSILHAHVQFTAFGPDDVPTDLTLHGEAHPNPPPFVAEPGNISGRSVTTASVAWFPAPWNMAGDQLLTQRTPSLAALVQEVVGSGGWEPGNSFVLLVFGSGTRRAITFDFDSDFAAQLVVQYRAPPMHLDLQVCMTPEDNPNLSSNPTPTEADLGPDCGGRVAAAVGGMSDACGYPSECQCAVTPGSLRSAGSVCNEVCLEEPLIIDCSNFDPAEGNVTATNAPGGEPVCTPRAPLAASLYGRASRCEVSGNVTIDVSGELREPAAEGTVDIFGGPCPGQSCPVGLSFSLDAEDVTYGNFFRSATFTDLAAVGNSLEGGEALLSATGEAVFAPGTTAATASGRRGSEQGAFEATNSELLHLGVDWDQDRTCSLAGALFGTTDPEVGECESASPSAGDLCTEDADCTDDPACSDGLCECEPFEEADMVMSADLAGALINQPPTADAGPDLVVECNRTGGATFLLHGAASDPDGNLVAFAWFHESRATPPIGRHPTVEVDQALDAEDHYIFRAIDSFGQADEDGQTTRVEDTTPPEIACNTSPTIRPPDAPITFIATAFDVCDDHVVPEVVGYDCFWFNPAGRRVDKRQSCQVSLGDDGVTIHDSGGVGTQITWDVRAQDASGNETLVTCATTVVRP
jgi:hypothetical protein